MRGVKKPVPVITSIKVENKLITEDFLKYEDKSLKKIKPGKFKKFTKIHNVTYRFFRKNGIHIRGGHIPRCKIFLYSFIRYSLCISSTDVNATHTEK